VSLGVATFHCMATPSDTDGRGYRMQCIVDKGMPTESKFTFIVGFPGTLGLIPFCYNEALERHSLRGWSKFFQGLVSGAGTVDTTKVPLNGAVPMSGALQMGGTGTEHKIIHLANGTAATDAATVGQMGTVIASAFTGKFGTGTATLSGGFTDVTVPDGAQIFLTRTARSADFGEVEPVSLTGTTYRLQSSNSLDSSSFKYLWVLL
jgi:hypothetical protein